MQHMGDQNKVFGIVTNVNALWVQVLLAKNNVQGVCPLSIARSSSSYVW